MARSPERDSLFLYKNYLVGINWGTMCDTRLRDLIHLIFTEKELEHKTR
jgi:hypothetical protein